MKLRSKWLTAFSALVLQVVPVVTADWKPAKRIEVIVPNAPGGGNDRLARLVLKIAHEQKLIDPLVNVIHKPGAGAITAAIGGHVDMPVAPAASVLPHVQAGRLRFVALAAPKRLDGALSAVPVWKAISTA